MQTIYLDISNKGVVPTVYAKQGDVGRKFEVVFTNSGLPYNPPDGSVFSVWYSGSSGEGNYTDIGDRSAFSINGNKVAVELITQMLVNDGTGVLCLILNEANGNQIGSWNIPYICEGVPGFESEGAKEYYTAFSESVEKLKQVTENLTPEAIGAAPAGFGLGLENGLYLNDCNDAVAFGLFVVGWQTANNPLNTYGALLVLPHNNTEKCQVISSSFNNCIVVRYMSGGAWSEWEWVNPPMVPGVEYRTTERHNGKVVYKRAISYGKGSSTGSMNIPTVNTACSLIELHVKAVASDGYGEMLDKYLTFNEAGTVVYVTASKDLSAYDITLTAKYTK